MKIEKHFIFYDGAEPTVRRSDSLMTGFFMKRLLLVSCTLQVCRLNQDVLKTWLKNEYNCTSDDKNC